MDGDGTKAGFDLELIAKVRDAVTIPIIASGGLTNLGDVRALCAVQHEGIAGAITGRAIYEGTIQFNEAQQLADALTAA